MEWRSKVKLVLDALKCLQQTTLTVLVAGLPEGLPLGEDDGHSQVLEGRHVEEGGVLVVTDVLGVHVGLVHVGRQTGNVAGTTRGAGTVEERKLRSLNTGSV